MMTNVSQPTLPLIMTDENDAMLTSIIHLLRQKGFVVIQENEATHANQAIIELDALSILRKVGEEWPEGAPVVLISAANVTQNPQLMAA